MRETIHLKNIPYEGCAQNVRVALGKIEGVRVVQVRREDLVAEVLYDPPATPLQMRELLLAGGYLADSHPNRT